MKGALTIIPVGTAAVTRKELTAAPRLEELQSGVGGYIEIVPGFSRFLGKPCVAFCDEDGKRKQMPVNSLATELWYEQVGDRYDWLVGPIVIVTGDEVLKAMSSDSDEEEEL
jgi:hypothetical protein